MDSAYGNAVAQKEAAERKIYKLSQQLEAAQREFERASQFLEAWAHFAGVTLPWAADSGLSIQDKAPRKKSVTQSSESVRVKNPPKEKISAWAVRIVRREGKPLNRAELYDKLVADGMVLHGGDPKVVMSTMLWRQKEVISYTPGRGYWPQGEPLPSGDAPMSSGDMQALNDKLARFYNEEGNAPQEVEDLF